MRYPKLTAKDSERAYEKFIRSLKSCSNIADARNLRDEISNQIQREMQTEKPDQLHLLRLNKGKKLLDQKIEYLSRTDSSQRSLKVHDTSNPRRQPSNQKITLQAILYDASGLSAFMQYMDRLNLVSLVKFYLVVDGFRAPSTEDGTKNTSPLTLQSWTDSDRLKILQIYNSYLTKPELRIPASLLIDIKRFLDAGEAASQSDYVSARRSVLEVQTIVFYKLQNPHFANFKSSDIFDRWITSKGISASSALMDTKQPWRESTKVNPFETQASKMLKAGTPPLRRSPASTSDLKSVLNISEQPRRSLDCPGRKPLFDDDYDSDYLANSTQSLNSAGEYVRKQGNNDNVINTMQAELDHIVDSRTETGLSLTQTLKEPAQDGITSLPHGMASEAHKSMPQERERPSIASLGLVGEPTRGTVFSDDLFGEEERFVEDEREDSDVNEKSEEDEIHEADPGDLGLIEAIDALAADIERLAAQESIVDSLTNKATLTNNVAELRILRKSKTSLQREIRRKELQRQQYTIQESDNSLYGRATVSIQSVMVAHSQEGEEYALCKLAFMK